jgi:hypothetical protein
MIFKLDPSNLITIGVIGAVCFLSIAAGGLVLQYLAVKSAVPSASYNRISSPPASAPVAATYTPARKPAVQKYPAQIVDYINGAVTDLWYEIEQFQQNLNDESVAGDKRQVLVQKLQSAQRRTQAVYVNLDTMLKSAKIADADEPLDPEPLSNVASAIDELVKEIQALPAQDAQSPQNMENQPGGARFAIAVGELSIWLEQGRERFSAKR